MGVLAPLTLLVLGAFTVQGYRDPHCIGNRDSIVHLFEWRWDDVAYECENFLGPMGFCAVQVSPANEHRIVDGQPWWERYQPVSYKLVSRSGDEAAFKNMVDKCNAAGVRIYVDIIINHMTGAGGTGHGSGGSYFDADNLQFPGVPYGPNDFNGEDMCHTAHQNIDTYDNAEVVRNCRLESLLDLRLSSNYVRDKIAEFLNHMLELGVMGFRIDTAKHMWPGDLKVIFNEKVHDVNGGGRPFIVQEVIDKGGNEAIHAHEYFETGRVTNFKFGLELAGVFRKYNPMKHLWNWGEGWGMWNTVDVVNFIDNHDSQRDGSPNLSHWEPRPYKAAVAFMLAHPYGMPRLMSSYEYDRSNRNLGPPAYPDTIATKPVPHNGNLCGDGWTCEHRWRQIYEMVAFRNIAQGMGVDNWWSGRDYEIAFSRGDKAFIAFNFEDSEMKTWLSTGLPGGRYCNIVTSVMKDKDTCVKEDDNEKGMGIVDVADDGRAEIWIPNDTPDPFLAIHIGAKLGDDPKTHW